jgi:uncharacterized protein YihD (DUF1040 family)
MSTYRIELVNQGSTICAEPHHTMRVHEEVLVFAFGVATTTNIETVKHAAEHMSKMFNIFEAMDVPMPKAAEEPVLVVVQEAPQEMASLDAVLEEMNDKTDEIVIGHVVSTETTDDDRVALRGLKKPGKRK